MDFATYVHPNYVYLDSEFLPNSLTRAGTVSFGLATRNASYYAVNADMDFDEIFFRSEPAPWLRKNVMNHLPTIPGRGASGVELDYEHPDVKPYAKISAEVSDFVRDACPNGSRDDVEFIVNSGSQDMVRFHSVISGNDWAAHEPWIPRYADDIARIKRRSYRLGLDKKELPVQAAETLHHPLYDAQYEMRVHGYILDRFGLI